VALAEQVATPRSVLEPAAVALHLLERVRPLLPEPGPAVVLGAGPMGIAIARVLVARGWEALALEPQAARRAMAERCGLRAAPAAAGEAEAAGLGDAPRLVVETSASEPGVALAEQVATPRSVLALVGRAPRGPAAAALLLGELAAVGVKGGAGHYEEAVRLAAAGAVPTEQLVTHAYPFADAQRAFEETADPARGVVRAVLEGAW
jgi:threonine dehydrogenase-like Zn-dependent dehydrogenase